MRERKDGVREVRIGRWEREVKWRKEGKPKKKERKTEERRERKKTNFILQHVLHSNHKYILFNTLRNIRAT